MGQIPGHISNNGNKGTKSCYAESQNGLRVAALTPEDLLNAKSHSYPEWLLIVGIVATTYFTRFDPSIIGGSGLNFSVRDGKR